MTSEQLEKAPHIRCDVDDYTVEFDGRKWWRVFVKADPLPDRPGLASIQAESLAIAGNGEFYMPGWTYLSRFVNEEQAAKYVRGRCSVEETPTRYYHDFCRCGCPVEGWEYVKSEGLVFERCKKCGNPLRHNIMLRFQAKIASDFDLDAFLEE